MASNTRATAIKVAEKRKREKTDQDGASQKKQRKQKKDETDQDDSKPTTRRKGGVSIVENAEDGTSSIFARKSRLNGDVSQRSDKSVSQRWQISEPMGGRMADVDPIFTADEKYLIITYHTSLQVYSIADSLLVRRIPLPVTGANNGAPYIVASALSQVSKNIVWAAASDGRIWKIDWTTGAGSDDCFQTKSRLVFSMTVDAIPLKKKFSDVVFVSERDGKASKIVAYDPTVLTETTSQELQSQPGTLNILRAFSGGKILVGAAKDTIVLGQLKPSGASTVQDLAYDFYSVKTDDDICSLSVRHTYRKQGSKRKPSQDSNEIVADVAIGCVRGKILVYSDLVAQLQANLQARPVKGNLKPQKLHWHQKAVHSVAWSEDGNYLISGGSESVLTLWQLDTGKRDYLPHLSASIENIVVSPRGSSYAIHLDDNSTMVLSTAEMKPTTYISGLQSLVFETQASKDSLVNRVAETLDEINAPLSAVVNPDDPSQVLLCVGSSQQASRSGALPVTPLLQRFDMGSFQSISKQPLTRTNATESYHTSKGHPILEPRASQLAISYDGKWLATIDEWEPPERDVTGIDEGSSAAKDYCRERREIYLKFWALNGDGSPMELSSRINGPHSTRQSETVFDVAADNVANRFATVGDDAYVRLWTPKLRQRDGLAATGATGQQLVSWSCVQTIGLGESIKSQDELLPFDGRASYKRSGALTFSEDGSILFVAFGFYNEVVVYIIDMESGEIRNTLHEMCRGAVRDLQLLNSSLIILSDDLAIYDLVRDELQYGVQMSDTYGSAAQMTHLAVDRKSRTFALAVPNLKGTQGKLSKGAFSDVAVISLDDNEPLFMKKLPHLVTSLLPAVGTSGFIAIDSAAQIWSIVEGTESATIARSLADLKLTDLKLDDKDVSEEPIEQTKAVILNGDDDEEDSDDEQIDEMEVDETDDVHAVVVAPQRLAEIFDAAPAFAMPSIEDIFFQVAGLFSSKMPESSSA